MLRRTVFAVGVLGSFLCSDASAQSSLREGTKIRVTSQGGPRVTGVVSAATPDSLFLLAEGGGRYSVSRSSIETLQVSHGRSASAGAKKGALWGLGIFGGFGVLTAVALESDQGWENTYGNTNAWTFATVIAAEGAGIGAIIGALVKSEKWTEMSAQPTLGVTKTGIRLGFSLR